MTDFDKAFPEISFQLWLETKNLVIAKIVHADHKEWFYAIPDDDWRECFEQGFSPLESVMAFFEDAEGTEQLLQPDTYGAG